MKRTAIAAILALAFVCCAAMAAFTARSMDRAWGASAVCSADALTSQDLLLLTALRPDLGWTAYRQSAPKQMVSDAMPDRTAKAAVLSFLGAPERIAIFPLVSGRLPQSDERSVCALDSDSAFLLFGSIDPGAVFVRLDGKLMRVVGVIDAQRPLMLIPAEEGSQGGLTGEEQGAKTQVMTFDRLVADGREALLTLQNMLGIEPDPFELSGAEFVRLTRLLCAAPWLAAVAYTVAALSRRGGIWRFAGVTLLFFLSLGALLAVLMSIPVRLLPARWSDLEFYGKQITAFKARPFRAPDVRGALKSDVLRVGLLSAAACIALWMERMWLRCGKSR